MSSEGAFKQNMLSNSHLIYTNLFLFQVFYVYNLSRVAEFAIAYISNNWFQI
jgi:hypothetical protein